MKYHALTLKLSKDLFEFFRDQFIALEVELMEALDVHDTFKLFSSQPFHLVIADLDNLKSTRQDELLKGLRRTRFVPIAVLTDQCTEDTVCHLVEIGVDLCLPKKLPQSILSSMVTALFRRYTAYNHYDDPADVEVAPFWCGDIFIDPLRHFVTVRNQPVKLRPREFSLLLYFMRNPHIVLTAEQICENAWGMEHSQNVGQSVYDLRQKIEYDPNNPIYIETVYRVGYRFLGYYGETCDRK